MDLTETKDELAYEDDVVCGMGHASYVLCVLGTLGWVYMGKRTFQLGGMPEGGWTPSLAAIVDMRGDRGEGLAIVVVSSFRLLFSIAVHTSSRGTSNLQIKLSIPHMHSRKSICERTVPKSSFSSASSSIYTVPSIPSHSIPCQSQVRSTTPSTGTHPYLMFMPSHTPISNHPLTSRQNPRLPPHLPQPAKHLFIPIYKPI